MDTTRADVLSCYGNTNRTTPNIDALAAEGVLFENTIAPVPLTLPSHSTMLTGTTPLYHGVHDNTGYQLGKSQVTLAEILKNKGFSTAAFIGSFILDSKFGLDQGFDSYNDDFGSGETSTGINERRAGDTTQLALDWIDGHHKENMFLFLHYYDPHSDYNPPEPYDSMFANSFLADTVHEFWSLYNGEVAYTDHCIGKVINKLKSLKIYDSTLIVVTADHGEMFGEHGELTHGYFLYRSNIRVPMIFKLPGSSSPQRIEDIAGIIDIVPTVCDLLDIETPTGIQGKNLAQYFSNTPPQSEDRHIYCESLFPTKYEANSLLGLISDRYKYIQTTRPELYDIIADPLETTNLIAYDPNLLAQNHESKRARLLKGRLGQIIEQTVTDGSNKKEIDEETLARLESLGYVAGGVKEDFSFDQTMDDPKDIIAYHSLNSRCNPMMFEKEFDELRKVSEKMISLRPDLYQGHLALGRMAMEVKEYNLAVKSFKKTLQCDSEQYNVHGLLSEALFELKQFDQSLVHLQEVLRLKPAMLGSHDALFTHAWLRATSIDDELYDPPKALELIRQAMDMAATKTKKKSGSSALRVLAAAQAANGNFPEAVETARQALQLAMPLGQKQIARDMLKELKLYKNNTPYRVQENQWLIEDIYEK